MPSEHCSLLGLFNMIMHNRLSLEPHFDKMYSLSLNSGFFFFNVLPGLEKIFPLMPVLIFKYRK